MRPLLLEIVIVVFFVVLVYQDFRHRKVSTILFPFLAILLVLYGLIGVLFKQWLEVRVLNLGFLTVEIVLLYIIYIIKYKDRSFFAAIGPADILVFVLMALAFDTLLFIILLPFWVVVSLSIGLIGGRIIKVRAKGVPLAGFIALQWCILIIYTRAETGESFASSKIWLWKILEWGTELI